MIKVYLNSCEFLFYSQNDHRDLLRRGHSFPTRRSSDLLEFLMNNSIPPTSFDGRSVLNNGCKKKSWTPALVIRNVHNFLCILHQPLSPVITLTKQTVIHYQSIHPSTAPLSRQLSWGEDHEPHMLFSHSSTQSTQSGCTSASRDASYFEHLTSNDWDEASATQLWQDSWVYSEVGSLSATVKSLEKSFGVRPALFDVHQSLPNCVLHTSELDLRI